MLNRIVLKCDPIRLDEQLVCNLSDLEHDSVAAACYRQAIKEFAVKVSPWSAIWIEQRAADLLAEKLR